jgi:hypothetical protein
VRPVPTPYPSFPSCASFCLEAPICSSLVRTIPSHTSPVGLQRWKGLGPRWRRVARSALGCPCLLAEYEDDGSPDLATVKPLIDGGTEGFKGHTRVLIPGVTPCFECTLWLFPPQTKFPLCTIAETPRSATRTLFESAGGACGAPSRTYFFFVFMNFVGPGAVWQGGRGRGGCFAWSGLA